MDDAVLGLAVLAAVLGVLLEGCGGSAGEVAPGGPAAALEAPDEPLAGHDAATGPDAGSDAAIAQPPTGVDADPHDAPAPPDAGKGPDAGDPAYDACRAAMCQDQAACGALPQDQTQLCGRPVDCGPCNWEVDPEAYAPGRKGVCGDDGHANRCGAFCASEPAGINWCTSNHHPGEWQVAFGCSAPWRLHRDPFTNALLREDRPGGVAGCQGFDSGGGNFVQCCP